MIRTNNPALSANAFARPQTWADAFGSAAPQARPKTMTLQGTVNTTLLLLAICAACAVATWAWIEPQIEVGQLSPTALAILAGGGIFGFLISMVMHFKPKISPILAPIYAAAQGAFVGAVSLVYHARFGGAIVLIAVMLTFGILAALLLAYKTRLIKPTENFKLGITAATGGLCFLWIATIVLNLFGLQIPYLYSMGPIGIGFAAFVVVIAALNLVLDFDFIEQGSQNQLPRYMQWYAAHGLLVTLVWLYVSLLRLLSLVSGRD
ncbi:MAG: Bax inhibitor-1/YccA family protein [Phycisphaerales bacterium]|nr:Bax inhibitor-1/YccA family protein [Phycisphaerales bacterium]